MRIALLLAFCLFVDVAVDEVLCGDASTRLAVGLPVAAVACAACVSAAAVCVSVVAVAVAVDDMVAVLVRCRLLERSDAVSDVGEVL